MHLVIESLGKQTLKANRLVLWLDEDEFSLQSIPQLLKNQIKRGLEVRFYRNIRSYKKIIPALKEFQSSKIITVDDDFLYPVDLIEILNNEEKKYKDCIIGMRAHTIKTNKKKILPYKKWTFESSSSDFNELTFLTTGAGTLFPKNIPRHHFCLEDEFMALCPFADDVWINLISIKFGIRRKRVDDKRSFRKRFIPLQNNQDIGLNIENVHNNKNDKQIQNVIAKFNITF
ncbi:hypothetical protein BZG75_04930 [Salinivibrio sp. AR640]|nr:hypothetical protein BZG75_04930 [Salinivibrio sp. AR640]